jgi:hypothetical protein
MRRHEPATGNSRIPVTLDDVILQVRYKAGDIIEEEISCDSEFMLDVMDRVAKALRDSFIPTVRSAQRESSPYYGLL